MLNNFCKPFMRFWSKNLLLIAGLLILITNIQAQNNGSIEVKKSTDKIILNGKVYFVHIVSKGETLYSIAKAYNVSVNDVISNNPAAANELKPEQVLRIPESSVRKDEVEIKKESGQLLHVVGVGQTLYSISRIYGVPVSEIEQLNPEVKYDSLQVNQVLKIPQKSKSTLAV